eukprot:TRINITY_DN4456_c0_g1_i1.p1 TRINITY_DN4456_c0_g1~~TRINITY_DN4456_c0_g1_i1.p1  ORF type:complete len:318 (+),score=136.29 TRINITY_DN4456_c0_g1_i1:98-1051(+)
MIKQIAVVVMIMWCISSHHDVAAQTQPCIQAGSITYACPPFAKQQQSSPGIEALMNPRPDYGRDTYNGSAKLTGKVALITGGDSGIGRAVAVAFAREGADIAISYLNEDEDAMEAKEVIEAAGRTCLLFPGDISNVTHIKYVVDSVVKSFGRIDILVNNAAAQGQRVDDFLDISYERIMNTFQVNIVAMFEFAKAAIPHMTKGSSIINTASVQAETPDFEILDYSSTKGAIVTFTKGLAKYTIQQGIRVNAVAPGATWTPLIVQSSSADSSAQFGMETPYGRPAQPAELAPAYVLLASDSASYTNGEIVTVDGSGSL